MRKGALHARHEQLALIHLSVVLRSRAQPKLHLRAVVARSVPGEVARASRRWNRRRWQRLSRGECAVAKISIRRDALVGLKAKDVPGLCKPSACLRHALEDQQRVAPVDASVDVHVPRRGASRHACSCDSKQQRCRECRRTCYHPVERLRELLRVCEPLFSALAGNSRACTRTGSTFIVPLWRALCMGLCGSTLDRVTLRTRRCRGQLLQLPFQN